MTADLTLLEDFPDQPQVTERVQDRTLKHPSNRSRSGHGVHMFLYRAVAGRPGGDGAIVHLRGISSTNSSIRTVVNPTDPGPRVP